MAKRTEDGFDMTSLHENVHGDFVHRDYAAHYFRWSFAHVFCPGKRVLDAGCGSDAPLPRVFIQGKAYVPELYVGVDIGPIKKKVGQKWARFFEKTNFIEAQPQIVNEFGGFDVAVSFEVLEHLPPDQAIPYLHAIRASVYAGGTLLLSTPVFNGKAARNHVKEYTAEEVRALIEASGFQVVDRFGTFASWNDVMAQADPHEKELVKELARFHSKEVLACFLAPKYPDASRNNVWVCR